MNNYETTELTKQTDKELFIKKVAEDMKKMKINKAPWYKVNLSKAERKLPEAEREKIRQSRWYDNLPDKKNILV